MEQTSIKRQKNIEMWSFNNMEKPIYQGLGSLKIHKPHWFGYPSFSSVIILLCIHYPVSRVSVIKKISKVFPSKKFCISPLRFLNNELLSPQRHRHKHFKGERESYNPNRENSWTFAGERTEICICWSGCTQPSNISAIAFNKAIG